MIPALDLLGRALLVGVFVVAAVAKLRDRPATREALGGFGVPARLTDPVAVALPVVELATAGLLVPRATAVVGAAAATALLSVFTIAIAVSLARGRRPACRCFGQLSAAPVGARTLIRNAALLVVSGGVLAAELSRPAADPVSSALHADRTVAIITAFVVSGAVVVGAIAVMLAVLRSYGLVLHRLDALERRLADLGYEDEGDYDETLPLPEVGLRPGTAAPLAGALEIGGRPFVREPSKPLLVLFTSPHCGPCEELLPEVAGWQRTHSEQLSIAVAVAAPADEVHEEQRRHELAHVIIDERSSVADAFEAHGTPAAVLVDQDGNVASWLAAGADAIRQLMHEAVRPAPVSVGEQVPQIDVPTIRGAPFSLTDLRGRRSAIIFWNPGCGFCRQMHERLRDYEEKVNGSGPSLVIASSGDHASTAAEGFSSTVVLDHDRLLADAFGAHGTPMAVLLGSDGTVASLVAAGVDGVMDLLAPLAVR